MSKRTVPEAILDAAVAVLKPYVPGLTATELIEALGNRNKTTTASPTLRKPLTRKQAAEILQVSIASVNCRMKDGTLRWFKISPRLVRIDPISVEELLQAQTTPAEPEA